MNKTHFGFEQIQEAQKRMRVSEVFNSVSSRYDLMNDVMSGGLHRLWKNFAIAQSGVRSGSKVLDIAGGTGDLSKRFAKIVGQEGEVWLSDINQRMLEAGRNRLLDQNIMLPAIICDAENLPMPDDYFDCISVAFGLRNMTHKDIALSEMYRVLKPGGRLLVLEFSKVWKPLEPLYDFYSFEVIPKLGSLITYDEDSYRYLAESIRVHPDQEQLKSLIEAAHFNDVEYFNLAFGIVALHKAYKY